jgi:hypothetical protein
MLSTLAVGDRRRGAASSPTPAPRRAEIPENDNNHALGALRYLIAKLGARKLGRKAKSTPTPPQPEQTEKVKEKKSLSLKNEVLGAQVWSVGR